MTKSVTLALLVVAGLASVIGQAQTVMPTAASIPLRFEFVKAGAKVATIAASVTSGSTGSIEIDGIPSLAFTPAQRADALEIVFAVGLSGLRPRMMLYGSAQGAIQLRSESGEWVEVRVSSERFSGS